MNKLLDIQDTGITLYGIANCDTVKKARAWLTGNGFEYRFHDFKKQGVPAEALAAWVQTLGWSKLLNRQGTTWRKFDAAVQAQVVDAATAQALMQQAPSVIKRPVVDWGGEVTVGFDQNTWQLR